MKSTNMTLAENHGLGSVRICDCGSLNLNIGLVTLHLDPETFLKTAALLRQAAEQYLKRNEQVTTASGLSPALRSPSGRFTN
jgi:hypothetical protein